MKKLLLPLRNVVKKKKEKKILVNFKKTLIPDEFVCICRFLKKRYHHRIHMRFQSLSQMEKHFWPSLDHFYLHNLLLSNLLSYQKIKKFTKAADRQTWLRRFFSSSSNKRTTALISFLKIWKNWLWLIYFMKHLL